MQRSSLYLVIAVLTAFVVGFGVLMVYQQTQKPGLEIKVNSNGISVHGNG